MCGIFGIINSNNSEELIQKEFQKGSKRGPEYSTLKKYENTHVGFHRLAINGLNHISNQPIEINNKILICNGEIYNYKELSKNNNINLKTDSDCEIILHLYELYGIEYTLNLLDGVFSFMIYDIEKKIIILSRDPYGVRPLYYFHENKTFGFSSELKTIYNLCINKSKLKYFIPSNYAIININNIEFSYVKYLCFPFRTINYKLNDLYVKIVENIMFSVEKRVIGTTERPVACLLSGGLDSSLVTSLVNYIMKERYNYKLKTFSIGLKGSEDLKYAKIVAHHLNTDHTEIIVSEDDFFNSIPEVVKNIESYDTTTIRASVGNYLVAKYIKENTDCKVIFNGDGADELMGGYLYFKNAPNAYEFDKECKNLLKNIYMFDVLRSDKSISSNGLEPRTPFLDRSWVEFYLSIPKELRYESNKQCEKYLIRKSFSEIMPHLLPKEILWRKKEAFSDGVSSLNKSWYQIINDKINLLTENDNILKEKLLNNINIEKKNYPKTLEQSYYFELYNKDYNGTNDLMKYYWMPKYVNATDASARTLKIYNE